MWESALHQKLSNDATLSGYVSTYGGRPSIFSERAPEKAQMPYITFKINRQRASDNVVQKFNVYIDFWDRDKSAADSRKAAKRIEYLLDYTTLSHSEYSCIRLFFFSGGPIDEDDPRDIHHNLQFEARAGRKLFAEI
jgi:hypothetical protein